MALFGQIAEFVSEEEEWPQYVECLEHYLCTNAIDEEVVFLVWGSNVQPLEAHLRDPSEARKVGCGQLRVLADPQVLLEH